MANQEKINPGFNEVFETVESTEHNLILHNDNVNSFDFVIDSLVEICRHDNHQAEQCAFITHYKGKCDVKKGPFEELNQMKAQFDTKGLTVSIV